MIIVLSPESIASKHVQDEINYAQEEKKRIIPILIQSCKIPYDLRLIQHIDFASNYDKGFGGLLRAIKTNNLVIRNADDLEESPVIPYKSIEGVSGALIRPPFSGNPEKSTLFSFRKGSILIVVFLLIMAVSIISVKYWWVPRQSSLSLQSMSSDYLKNESMSIKTDSLISSTTEAAEDTSTGETAPLSKEVVKVKKEPTPKKPIVFDDLGSFSDGLARAKKGNKWGYINKKYKVVIPI